MLLLLLLAVAILLPPYFGTYYIRFATQIAIYGMAALSVDLLLGYTGLITFGQAALFGVGVATVSVPSGASVPEDPVDGVLAYLAARGLPNHLPHTTGASRRTRKVE